MNTVRDISLHGRGRVWVSGYFVVVSFLNAKPGSLLHVFYLVDGCFLIVHSLCMLQVNQFLDIGCVTLADRVR